MVEQTFCKLPQCQRRIIEIDKDIAISRTDYQLVLSDYPVDNLLSDK